MTTVFGPGLQVNYQQGVPGYVHMPTEAQQAGSAASYLDLLDQNHVYSGDITIPAVTDYSTDLGATYSRNDSADLLTGRLSEQESTGNLTLLNPVENTAREPLEMLAKTRPSQGPLGYLIN